MSGDSGIRMRFTEEDYEEYTYSWPNIIKKIWITVQAIVMIQFMVRGLIYYSRLLQAWTKVQWLLLFQGVQFMYLIINEYVWHDMTGIYLNLLLCSYGHFLTFCIVMDSCLCDYDHSQSRSMAVLNIGGRIFFHLMFVVLLILAYFTRSCEENLYPFSFVCLGFFIFF